MKTMADHVPIPKIFGRYPEKVLQFGEGNFLRAFADWMIDRANAKGLFKGSIALCQPIAEGSCDWINLQDGLYTLVMRGRENGEAKEKIEVVTSVSRCINPYKDFDAVLELSESPELKVIISNTTEAGIAYRAGDLLTDDPPASYPAKLTACLAARFNALKDTPESELLVLPVELIDDNGDKLKSIVKRYADDWELGAKFSAWLDRRVHICNTLVDRIVTGHPKDEIGEFEARLGYEDRLLVASELFNLWVIEGKQEWREILPIHESGANVVWTDDVGPYKKRKVRILNGAHTSTVLAAYLAGHELVREFMHDDVFLNYMNRLIFDEIIPTIDLPREDLNAFARAVSDRFDNPYIKHRLLDIALNSCSKFAARCLPSLLDYFERNKELPKLLTFSLAAFIAFYKGEKKGGRYMGRRQGGLEYEIRDDADVLDFFAAAWGGGAQAAALAVLGRKEFWDGRDLAAVPGLLDAVVVHLREIERSNIRDVIAALLK